jgi:uncharacterized alpha-E superfamily protein
MAEFKTQDAPRFSLHRAARPMLARDADAMYWMSRYVERAEHIARLLLVNSNLLIDVGDLAPRLQQQQWESVLTIMHSPDAPEGKGDIGYRIQRYMAFDHDNSNSLVSCFTRARENARGIRENISAEMWESLNTLYWSITSEEAVIRFEDSSDDFYRQLMIGSMLFQGLTDQTLAHDQRWQFAQLAKFLERVDVTCRVIEAKFNILRDTEFLENALRNIHWMAVLRSCCAIEGYRRNFVGDMDPPRVASYLILERDFPRSIRYCVTMAHCAIAAIRSEVNPLAIDPAERILGRLNAQLEYAEPAEIFSEGLPSYLQKIQTAISETAIAVQRTYFLH